MCVCGESERRMLSRVTRLNLVGQIGAGTDERNTFCPGTVAGEDVPSRLVSDT